MNPKIALCPNKLVQYLQKEAKDFRRSDIVRFISENGIKMVNFMYPAGDQRLKTLNFVINSKEYLESILTFGERVDGSSLFPFIEAGNSDLYVIPRYRTAFVDPFAEVPTLTMLASFFDKDGHPLKTSPEYTLLKACQAFHEKTGMDFYTMGELEYYVIADDEGLYPATDQKGYHESGPYAKFNEFRTQCMEYISQTGAQIKYGHNEVGNFTLDGKVYEQNEIEFLPVPSPEAAGLHIHFKLMKGDENVMTNAEGVLSDDARKAIAGILTMAPSITAFGNKVPTSYLRLVPHQEAPTNICWGDRNRSLGWSGKVDMCAQANPLEKDDIVPPAQKQTAELRSSDCSADIYQLLAGMTVAARHGFEMPDAMQVAEDTYVAVNIHKDENKDKLASLATLPDSCMASADCLEKQREVYQKYEVFTPEMVDGIISDLRKFHDSDLRAKVNASPGAMMDLVHKYWHCG